MTPCSLRMKKLMNIRPWIRLSVRIQAYKEVLLQDEEVDEYLPLDKTFRSSLT